MTVRIGDRGMTSTVLKPGGFVLVADVRHPARCQSGFVEVSTEVIVIGGDNLGLIVCAATRVADVAELPRQGEVVHSSFGAKVSVTGKAAERRRLERYRRAATRSWICGGTCGFIFSLIAAGQVRSAWPTLSPGQPWLVPALLIVIGTVWGLVVGRTLRGAFEQVERLPSMKLTFSATIVTLAGTIAALIYVMPERGVWGGLATALSTTVILGAALPAIAMVGEWQSGNSDEQASETETAIESDSS